MLKDDRTCDLKCENCKYENNDKECLIVLLTTLNAEVIIEEDMREPGDTISNN